MTWSSHNRLMTTATIPTSTSSATRALRANAGYCASCALVALAASDPLSEALDLPRWLLLTVGTGLAAYAPLIWLFSTRRPVRRPELLLALWGDVGWCGVAVTLIASPSSLSDAARGALALVSVPVAVLATWEWRAAHDG